LRSATTFDNKSKIIRWQWHGCTYETAKLDVTVTWAAAELPPKAMRLSMAEDIALAQSVLKV
jgi:hypothetical protein